MSDLTGTIEFSHTPQRGLPEDGAHYLVVVSGSETGLRREVTAQPFVIGRDPACALPLSDGGVSKRHCRLYLHRGGVVLEDLGSTNGTFLDGARIAGRARARPEAIVQVGEHVLRLEFRSRREVARLAEIAGDLLAARAYVEALIPAPLEAGPLRTSAIFQPCAVLGGDVFGHHALDERRTALYLLDVCGHGTGAAIHSASVVHLLRSGTLGADSGAPAAVLARLEQSFPMESHAGMYFSIWYGVYHAHERRLEYASAGHPPALLVAAGAARARRLQTPNPPIGVLGGASFAQAEVRCEEGERLYVFSDGVFEIVDAGGRAWGFDDFERLVLTPAAPARDESARLRRAVVDAAGRDSFDDDFSLLVATFP
jgi:serine phosphatase RsbU (regulator of sigma subunit)